MMMVSLKWDNFRKPHVYMKMRVHIAEAAHHAPTAGRPRSRSLTPSRPPSLRSLPPPPRVPTTFLSHSKLRRNFPTPPGPPPPAACRATGTARAPAPPVPGLPSRVSGLAPLLSPPVASWHLQPPERPQHSAVALPALTAGINTTRCLPYTRSGTPAPPSPRCSMLGTASHGLLRREALAPLHPGRPQYATRAVLQVLALVADFRLPRWRSNDVLNARPPLPHSPPLPFTLPPSSSLPSRPDDPFLPPPTPSPLAAYLQTLPRLLPPPPPLPPTPRPQPSPAPRRQYEQGWAR